MNVFKSIILSSILLTTNFCHINFNNYIRGYDVYYFLNEKTNTPSFFGDTTIKINYTHLVNQTQKICLDLTAEIGYIENEVAKNQVLKIDGKKLFYSNNELIKTETFYGDNNIVIYTIEESQTTVTNYIYNDQIDLYFISNAHAANTRDITKILPTYKIDYKNNELFYNYKNEYKTIDYYFNYIDGFNKGNYHAEWQYDGYKEIIDMTFNREENLVIKEIDIDNYTYLEGKILI